MQMSKGAFAGHIGVSPGRVSQMIAEGLIGRDALVGEGRMAQIDVEKAVAQIRARRDTGQALGNGLMTRLEATPKGDGVLPAKDPDTTELIARERLDSERRKNRLAEIEEARRLGQLVPVEDMRREMGKELQRQANVYEGMIPDVANALAAQYGLPARDIIHLIRKVQAEKRAASAEARRQDAAEMPDSIEAVLK